MLVYDLRNHFDPETKLQIRHTSTDELKWEGYVHELECKSFHGATCCIDLIMPISTGGEKFWPDFTVYFHYDDEFPATILSRKAIDRLFPWDYNSQVSGVITGYHKLTHADNGGEAK